ncbi:transcriptional corepressor SEUSS-like, partial [Trifolium medium]|nr:transcriptional corepressor SEUSS-like [Trifolium medium]
DNNIEFWRKFVAEYFAPNAKKKWCVSMYGSSDKRLEFSLRMYGTAEYVIANLAVATVEVLPRLYKIKYESGTLEELLYVDMPREYHNSSGQIVLDYAKAIQESVFEQLRVVCDGQLRIVFSSDLKVAYRNQNIYAPGNFEPVGTKSSSPEDCYHIEYINFF